MANEILQLSKEAKDDETKIYKIIEEFGTFANEFPTVFESILYEKEFSKKAFKLYVNYRRNEPAIYKEECQSIEDLIQYPLYVRKLEIRHPMKHECAYCSEYANYLRKHVGDAHRHHKQTIKKFIEDATSRIERETDESNEMLKDEILQRIKSQHA